MAELDLIQELHLRESAEAYRGTLAFLRPVKQVKRERTRKQQKCPTEAISFPTECCALQVGSVLPLVLFVLSEKGLFGFSGLRGFFQIISHFCGEGLLGIVSAAPSLAVPSRQSWRRKWEKGVEEVRI